MVRINFSKIVLLFEDFKSYFRIKKCIYERLVQNLEQRLYRDQGAEKISLESK